MPSAAGAKRFFMETVTGVLILAVAGNALTGIAWALLQPLLPSSVTSGSFFAMLQARVPVGYVLGPYAVSLVFIGWLLDRQYRVRIKVVESRENMAAAERQRAEEERARVQSELDRVIERQKHVTPAAHDSHALAFRIAAVIDDASTRLANCNLDEVVRKLREGSPELQVDEIEEMVGRMRAVEVITTSGVSLRMATGWADRLRRHIAGGTT